MTVSALSAAKLMGKKANWSLSNLKMQKILYLANMSYLAKTEETLVYGNFEAWDYGPVLPELYHKIKIFGAGPVADIFRSVSDMEIDSAEYSMLNSATDKLSGFSGAKLVAITHWKRGAWAKNYLPGSRGKIIPNEHLIEEYNLRMKKMCNGDGGR